MKHVPLFFRFGHVVFGRGFVADVRFLGRATCTREFGSVWMYGVNPGALAEEGDTLQAACSNFRNALAGVLFDLAEGAADFADFSEAAQSFFEATDETSANEWLAAREAVRAGEDPGLDPGTELRRETGDPEFGFRVTEIHTPEAAPALNHFAPDQPHLLAA